MFTLLTFASVLFVFALIGWTIAILLTREESKKLIKEELGNMFEITKMLLVSINSLIKILINSSFPSGSDKSKGIDEQLLKFVPPVSDKQEENKAA